MKIKNLKMDEALDVITVDTQLNTKGMRELRKKILNNPNPITLNLDKVTKVDSSGIGQLLKLQREHGANRRIKLANLHPKVKMFLELTQVARLFDIDEAPVTQIGIAA